MCHYDILTRENDYFSNMRLTQLILYQCTIMTCAKMARGIVACGISPPHRVIMLSVVLLSVIMLSVVMLSVIMLSVVMLSIVMLSVIMLSVIMLSVVMQNVVMLAVLAPRDSPCHVFTAVKGLPLNQG